MRNTVEVYSDQKPITSGSSSKDFEILGYEDGTGHRVTEVFGHFEKIRDGVLTISTPRTFLNVKVEKVLGEIKPEKNIHLVLVGEDEYLIDHPKDLSWSDCRISYKVF